MLLVPMMSKNPAAAGGGGSAVSVNNTMSGGNGASGKSQQVSTNTTIQSTGLTINSGTNSMLVTLLVWSSGTAPTGVTAEWDSAGTPQALTQAGTVQFDTNSSVAIFYLLNPTVGNKTLTANWTNAQDCVMSAICFDNAGGIAAGDTQQNSTNTVTVTSGANDATVAVYNCDGGTPTGSQTNIFDNSALGPSSSGDYALGGSSNAHTFTIGSSTFRVTIGIHVTAA